MDPLRKTARFAGWLWIITFVTSIAAFFFCYKPVLDDPSLITGVGSDPTTRVAIGAVLEIALIIANVGTAVVFFPILKRQSEAGAIGYVGARLVECTFIAIGIIAMLTFLFMMQEGTGTKDLGVDLRRDLRPGVPGRTGLLRRFRNGLLLGWLMYRSELVPRGMAMLGLIGGPLVMASGIAIMLDLTKRGSPLPGHRDDPGVLLGAVPRYLPRRQGIQAVAHHCGAGLTSWPGDGLGLVHPFALSKGEEREDDNLSVCSVWQGSQRWWQGSVTCSSGSSIHRTFRRPSPPPAGRSFTFLPAPCPSSACSAWRGSTPGRQ